jgi:hypothetical protein
LKSRSLLPCDSDPDNLLFDHGHNLIIGRQYEPFVIPCKPTSPQVRVELIKEDGEVIQLFDDRRGFELVVNSSGYSYVDCKGFLNETERELQFSYDVLEMRMSTFHLLTPPLSLMTYLINNFQCKFLQNKIYSFGRFSFFAANTIYILIYQMSQVEGIQTFNIHSLICITSIV